MTNEINKSLELVVQLNGQGLIGRTDYYISHLPSERFLRFIGKDIMSVECIEGKESVVDWIIRRHLGYSTVVSNDKWRKQYNEREWTFEKMKENMGNIDVWKKWKERYDEQYKYISSELKEALIKDVFIGNGYYYIKPFIKVKTTFNVKVDPIHFDVIFEEEKEIYKLTWKTKNRTFSQSSKMFDLEKTQYRHAEKLIDYCCEQMGHPVHRIYSD